MNFIPYGDDCKKKTIFEWHLSHYLNLSFSHVLVGDLRILCPGGWLFLIQELLQWEGHWRGGYGTTAIRGPCETVGRCCQQERSAVWWQNKWPCYWWPSPFDFHFTSRNHPFPRLSNHCTPTVPFWKHPKIIVDMFHLYLFESMTIRVFYSHFCWGKWVCTELCNIDCTCLYIPGSTSATKCVLLAKGHANLTHWHPCVDDLAKWRAAQLYRWTCHWGIIYRLRFPGCEHIHCYPLWRIPTWAG